MNFTDWATEREVLDYFLEVFEKDSVMSTRPENGVWEPPLGQSPHGSYTFRYSLPGDPQKFCGSGDSDWGTRTDKPCYKVNIDRGNISFSHLQSGYRDRWNSNQAISNNQTEPQQSVGIQQMNSVLYALGQYVEAIKPTQLQWSAVAKSRPGAKNKDARKKVYFLWAAKNIFPEYVPVNDSYWQRKDYFFSDRGQAADLAQYGELPTSEEIEKMDAKQFLKLLTDLYSEKDRKDREEIERQDRAERERREQEYAAYLADPVKNPNGIALGDLVYNKEENDQGDDSGGESYRHGRLWRVSDFMRDTYGDHGPRNNLVAYLTAENEEGDELRHRYTDDSTYKALKQLYKATPENRTTRSAMVADRDASRLRAAAEEARRYQEYLTNPIYNPQGVQVGDFVFIKQVGYSRHGTYGRIAEIKLDQYDDYNSRPDNADDSTHGFYAVVTPERDSDYDVFRSSSMKVPIKYLYKDTPENRRIRQHNISIHNYDGRMQLPPEQQQQATPAQTATTVPTAPGPTPAAPLTW